jgi:20S proteasome alpha/beta subunit
MITMTLVLGAPCKDGVAIIADKKIVDLATKQFLKYDLKIRAPIRNVIFGYSGSTDMFEVFHRYVVGDLMILRDDQAKYTQENLLQKFGSIMHILRKIRNNMDFALDVIVGRIFPGNIPSDLHVINSRGYSKSIAKWTAIGQGKIQARPLIERKWNPSMMMKDFAGLSYCVIKYIENENLDESVGTGKVEPSIKYLADDTELDNEPSDIELNNLKNASSQYTVDL